MDNTITAASIRKIYKTNIREPGLKGSVKSLFNPKQQEIIAVSDVSLTIGQGELVGYIGPNGAGKSTTIKMLTGILTPTSGKLMVCGINPQKDRIQNALNIGVVFGQRTQLWWDLPVNETFELIRRMYEIDYVDYKKNLAEFTHVLGLQSFINRPVRQLSLGQRMRAEIASALMHNPKVLFLDEPTIGLDVSVKYSIRKFIKYINEERKVTILLTTHDLQDIEELSSRVIVIDQGAIGFSGSVNELKRESSFSKTLDVTFSNPVSFLDIPGVHITHEENSMNATLKIDDKTSPMELMQLLLREYPVSDIDINGPSIDDIVMEIYKHEKES